MKSKLIQGSNVTFPEFTGERAYMVAFNGKLPDYLKRWQVTVDAMLDGIEVNGTMCFTVDQGLVKAGNTHRRGGVHIDGNYDLGSNGFRAGYPKFQLPSPPQSDPPSFNPIPKFLLGGALGGGGILLASDQIGCRAFTGTFEGSPNLGGDCSHIDLSGATVITQQPNKAYLGNVTMLHETIPAAEDFNRTFVRIIMPPTFKVAA